MSVVTVLAPLRRAGRGPRCRRPRGPASPERDDAGRVVGLIQAVEQRGAQVEQAATLLRARLQRHVDASREVPAEVTALAAQRWHERAAAASADLGVDAGERLVEDQRKRVEIRLGPDVVAVGLLGRHVGEGADDVAGARERRTADHMRNPEVGELRAIARARTPVGNQHVGGLDVAVDHAQAVRVGKGIAERDTYLEDFAVGELALLEQRVECASAYELGDQVGAVVVDRGLVQSDDRRMLEPGRGARLALEARLDHAFPGQQFDRDVALEPLVARRPDGRRRRFPAAW